MERATRAFAPTGGRGRGTFQRLRTDPRLAGAVTSLTWAWRFFIRFTPSLPAFLVIYTVFWLIYALSAGGSTKAQFFPRTRAALAVLLFVIPVWGALMTAYTILSAAFSHTAWRRDEDNFSQYHQVSEHSISLLGSSRASTEVEDSDDAEANDGGYEERSQFRVASASKHSYFPRWSAYAIAMVVGIFLFTTREFEKDWRWRSAIDSAVAQNSPEGGGLGERVFVAATFHDNHFPLVFWIKQMKRLAAYVGSDNIYFSILESYSTDDTPDLLNLFSKDLHSMGIQHRIVTNDTSISLASKSDRDHIRFHAATRNFVMRPLTELAEQGQTFDRIVWSNDVWLHAESVVELLHTWNKEYDMACGLDFEINGDVWVLRDRLGGVVSGRWPYFWDDVSRKAIINEEPAPVFSCWNGVLAVRAEPFYEPRHRSANSSRLRHEPLQPMLVPGHPMYADHKSTAPFEQPKLDFRDSAEGECFSSESFLMPYDLRRRFLMDKIVVVPQAITAYNFPKYFWFKYVLRHWVMRWYMRNVENGYGFQDGQVILGGSERLYTWDGGQCHDDPHFKASESSHRLSKRFSTKSF